jgi:hypothetical protein
LAPQQLDGSVEPFSRNKTPQWTPIIFFIKYENLGARPPLTQGDQKNQGRTSCRGVSPCKISLPCDFRFVQKKIANLNLWRPLAAITRNRNRSIFFLGTGAKGSSRRPIGIKNTRAEVEILSLLFHGSSQTYGRSTAYILR